MNALIKLRRPRKYRNEPVTVDGHRFPSKAEARRYVELKLLQQAGEIRNLELQPRYALSANGQLVGHYIGDFTYQLAHAEQWIVEDVKSKATKTPLYRWKIRHLEAEWGVIVREVA